MGASVLFVDDDRNLCQIVARALRGEGYDVHTAFDGDSALAQIQEDCPDLLLLDVLLPRKDGFQVLEELRALGRPFDALPVVLLTSCTPTPAYSSRAIALDALELITKPVPLDRLLEIVVSHVGEAKPGEAGAAASSARRTHISGQLDKIPFPAVLHHLHGLRATGVLHLESEKKRKWIQLRDGYPVAVRSNLVRETLGNFLERTGRITHDVLETSRREMEKQARRQGEVLVAMHVLSEEQVAEALREQADEKLFEIFSWETGRFQFERDAQLEKANVLGVGRSPANLILEGVRSRFPIERIDRYLRSQALRAVRHGSSPFYRFQELHMDPNEDALLRGLDGTTPLSGFLREEEGVRRTVYALLAAGLLELQGGPPERPAATEAPPRPRPQPQPQRETAPPAARVAPAPPAARVGPAPSPVSKPVTPAFRPASAPKPPPPASKPAAPAKPAPAKPPAQAVRPAPAPPRSAPKAPAPPAKPATPAPTPVRSSTPKPAAKASSVSPPPRRAQPSAASVEDQYPELAAFAAKLGNNNFFDLLGVQETSSHDQVRRAAELILARVHPDKFKSASLAVKQLAEQVFSRVNEAQQVLADPRRRQEHILGHKRAEREKTANKQAERALQAESAFRDGDAALKARDYEGAMRWFGKALQLYPDEGDHHAHYGYVLYLCHPSDPGMVGEAMEHVRRGLKTASHRDKAFLFMGRLHKALGQNEVAEKMFTRAVQIQPECVEAMRELRLINMRREKSKGIVARLLKR